MSSTTIKGVWVGEKVEDLAEFRNSHGSAPVVWNELCKHYLKAKDFSFLERMEELWPLYKSHYLADHHRAVLMLTFDNAILLAADYQQAALDIRRFLIDFPEQPGRVNHWPAIAGILEGTPNCPAIGFHWTSVDADSWSPEFDEETHEEIWDWDIYWDVYAELREVKKVLACTESAEAEQ